MLTVWFRSCTATPSAAGLRPVHFEIELRNARPELRLRIGQVGELLEPIDEAVHLLFE